MQGIKWLEGNKIQITPPKNPKKITGTRFATILGLNPWATEFEVWCAITRLYEKPFEDTKYTLAGKAIEPKQAKYIEKNCGIDIIRPKDVWGEDYFKKTYGDFFPEDKVLGGMWDYIGLDDKGNEDCIFEMKTTKRVEDWEGDVPEYYALQAGLYAYLKKLNNVCMVASFLEDKDYDNPDNYKCSVDNTILIQFAMTGRYPDFDKKVKKARKWWDDHVVKGVSPTYDEVKDAEILKVLRTNSLNPDTEIEELIKEAEELKKEVTKVEDSIEEKVARLKVLNDLIKEHAISQFREGDKKVELKGNTYTWSISKSESTTIDKDALLNDGLLDKYSKKTESYRMSVK